MIRPLRPLDVASFLFSGRLKHANHAYTLDTVDNLEPTGLPLIEASQIVQVLRDRGCSWVWTQGNRSIALATARHRSGPESWELVQLVIGNANDSAIVDLLEKVVEQAAIASAQRVFIRLAADDPLTQTCRLAGFFPCFREVLYRCRPLNDGEYASDSLRMREPADDYSLFRLYNATTPSEVRFQYGMTFDQWRSAREKYLGQTQEFVYEKDGSIRGLLEANRRFRTGLVAATVNPEDFASTGFLWRYLLAKIRGVRYAYCIVPEYQVTMRRSLEREGFEAVRDYVMLARLMTATNEEKTARVPATIASA